MSDRTVFRNRIREEIREEYERMAGANVVIKTDVLVGAIVHRHMPTIYAMPDSDEAELFVGALNTATWDHAVDYMNQVAAQLDNGEQDKASGQMRFVGGGFESEVLQDRYAIKRGKDRVHVPLEQMSDLEIEAKAQDLELQARGLVRHAGELRRYLRWRSTDRQSA